MTVDIPAPLVKDGAGVPDVCARHGEPAAQRKKTVFRSYIPKWTYILIIFGLLPFAIVAGAVQKRVTARAWPFCPTCRRTRNRRLLLGAGLVVLAIAAVVVLASVLPADTSYGNGVIIGFVLLLVVGLGIIGRAGRAGIASGYVSGDGNTVHIRRPHPRFADGAEVARQRSGYQPYPPHGEPYLPRPS